jgi:hypothetical protein
MRRIALPAALPVAVSLVLGAGTAAAVQIQTSDPGKPILLDFTETADVAYHVDDGNIVGLPNAYDIFGTRTPGPNFDPTSDNYLDWINKFDAQLSWGRWHAELRFDSALFLNTPEVTGQISPSPCLSNAYVGACENRYLAQLLENRYINNFIVEKLSLNYLGDHFDLTAGDFYINYGRGIVISMIKIDALGVDTTVRGLNLSYRWGGFSANVAGGVTNVVNTDEATGEVAPDPDDGVVAARFEYRVPRWFTLGVDGAGFFQNPSTVLLTSYAPGSPTSQVAISPLGFGAISTQATAAGTQPPELVDTGNFSVTLDLPWLSKYGKLYIEEARQVQTTYTGGASFFSGGTPGQAGHSTTNGNAFLASGDVFLGPVTLLVEFKDYQSFYFPMLSSLSSTMFPAFFQQNVYNNPPNLEEIFQEESATQAIFGPRARLDVQLGEHFTPFASFAYFEDDTNQYDIWDAYLGLDANWQHHRSHASVSLGRRYEIYNQQSSEQGSAFQQELWLQYDVVQVLGPIYSLELEGLHRRFDLDVLTGHPWSWGYAYLSLKRSAWTATLGYEYNTQNPDLWRPQNPNAGFSWIISDHYTVRAFAGGREAGLRCINGVCRVFPGFTGASAELVVRY